MTKQRPQASTLKVGTHRQGYVVKTRRAGQSAKRIKYWAKDTKKPKSVKQACKARRAKPTKRKVGAKGKVGAKRKSVLRGGSREAIDFLFDVLNEDSDVHKQFSDELRRNPELFDAILRHARTMLQACQARGIKKVLPNEEEMSRQHRETEEILTDVEQQAHAIVTAHVAFRSRKYPRDYNLFSQDVRGRWFKITVDLEQDKLWESFQAHTPHFINIVQVDMQAVSCGSDETFVEAGNRLGLTIGSNSGFKQLYAKL